MALTHNSSVAGGEPKWSAVDKTRLPDNAFADQKNRKYPHHWVKNGEVGDDGVYVSGDMYLHPGGLDAAWAAANGARSGQEASPEVVAHLQKHRRALGLDDKADADFDDGETGEVFCGRRENKAFPFELKADGLDETGTFSGYASMFGGKPDTYGDIVDAGAFAETLAKGGRNGTGVAMLWQHRSDEPLGVWDEIVEDKKGLKVSGRLAMATQRGREAHELMKMGAIRGLSIGYDALDFYYETPKGNDQKIRHLKKVELWEISPVTFPALTRAQIAVVKGLREARTERELERALREAGLSRQDALYLAGLCRTSLRESGAEGARGLEAVAAALRGVNLSLDVYRRLHA
ncbi:MAG: HK97 family phage prohead protease [Desulforudis sp.]|nr:MAG: HK97 family phage prohead protease [Desulforudis sp.]